VSAQSSYTLRSWRGALVVLLPAAALVAAAALLGVWQDRPWRNGLTSVVITILAVIGAARATVRLRLDRRGVTARRPSPRMLLPRGAVDRHVPWDHVSQVVVSEAAVSVALRPDAPLPSWMQGRVWSPGEADDRVVLRAQTPGVDAAAVASTAKKLAPWVSISVIPGKGGPTGV